MKNKQFYPLGHFKINGWLFFVLMMLSFLLLSTLYPLTVKADENSGTMNGAPVLTNDAYYCADQYMWKVSLFVAKSDAVYDNNGDGKNIDDFYRIGSDAVYISPVISWDQWALGNRPSHTNNIYYTKGNKVATLQELSSKENNASLLNDVQTTTANNVNVMIDSNVPLVPQLCDGDLEPNGTYEDNWIGNMQNVKNYFNQENTAFKILNFYAEQAGISGSDKEKASKLLSKYTFTIDGRTVNGESNPSDWNPDWVLPSSVTETVTQPDGTVKTYTNTTSEVQWLVVYEPVSIVYVRDEAKTASTGESWWTGFAMTATDFAVTQIKHQMDWRYNELKWPAWTGLQEDAWASNENRLHVARLAFLLLGNSVITEKDWYGFPASKGYVVDENASPPNSRWTAQNQLRYGGWGMMRLDKPVTVKNGTDPKDMDYRPDTDVIYSCEIFSNKNAGDEGASDQVTVTYEIDGQKYYDKVTVPVGTQVTSYFKWHTPKVTQDTSYDLKITVSPFPYVTIGHGVYEYMHRTLTVRPLVENTPTDPKPGDTIPSDFNENMETPGNNNSEINPVITDKAVIKNVKEQTTGPYYKGDDVILEIMTNDATEAVTINNVDTGEAEILTPNSVGMNFLKSVTTNSETHEKTWVITFIPKSFGVNNYGFSPSNSAGYGDLYKYPIEVKIDPDIPIIYDVSIEPFCWCRHLTY